MSVAFYMDEHVHQAITHALKERGVDVLTVAADGRKETDDPLLMDRATELGRVLISYDRHMLQEATLRQRLGVPFTGLIFGHEQDLPTQMGLWIDALEEASIAALPADFAGLVKYLPHLF